MRDENLFGHWIDNNPVNSFKSKTSNVNRDFQGFTRLCSVRKYNCKLVKFAISEWFVCFGLKACKERSTERHLPPSTITSFKPALPFWDNRALKSHGYKISVLEKSLMVLFFQISCMLPIWLCPNIQFLYPTQTTAQLKQVFKRLKKLLKQLNNFCHTQATYLKS